MVEKMSLYIRRIYMRDRTERRGSKIQGEYALQESLVLLSESKEWNKERLRVCPCSILVEVTGVVGGTGRSAVGS